MINRLQRIGAVVLALAATAPARATAAPPPSPPPAAGQAQPAITMAPDCKFTMIGTRFRPGDNVPVAVTLRNTGQWCFTGFGFSNLGTGGTRAIDQPAHGELRTIIRKEFLVIAYRSKPGYSGSDGFVIAIPSALAGSDFRYTASVTVEP